MTTPHNRAKSSDDSHPAMLPLASLLRAAADGELADHQLQVLSDHLSRHPDDAQRIRFEQQLRLACARVASSDGTATPAPLRAHVETIIEQSRSESSPRVVTHERGGRTQAASKRRSRFMWALGTLAAIVVAGVGLQLSGFFRGPTFAESPDRARVVLSGFLDGEHRRCTVDERALKRKMTEYSLSEAPAKYRNLLGTELSVANVEQAGYVFLGAGRCMVPGSGPSVHMVFAEAGGTPSPKVATPTCDPTRLSLFIQKDTGEVPIKPDITYRLDCAPDGPLVVVWLRGGLVYYLVTETNKAEDSVLDKLGIAAATQPL